jgi:DNA-binding NtrC family response regulator
MSDERQKAMLPVLAVQESETRVASTCRQARNLLRREPFDLVLTDMSLPDGNWLTISRESNHADPPPALVVCLPRPAERLSAILGAGHVQVLMPPWERQAIQLAVEEALGLGTGGSAAGPFTPEPHHAPLPA